jgi:indole-3-glycerol phosphate synthase
MAAPPNILDAIVARKRLEVAALPAQTLSVEHLRAAARRHEPRRDFIAALQAPRAGALALIAEVKKASPSAGIICPDFDPVRIAREYEAAGASCLSVLTDEPFFQGSLEYLRQVRAAVKLPLLRKDFIIDERQILQALEWGADAVLLIVSILDDRQLRDYPVLAAAAGMAALVEVHEEAELDRALQSGARLIGVNNRDLKTFTVDLGTTERLAKRLRRRTDGGSTLLVAESGIQTATDVGRLRDCGVCAILVGEYLMRGDSIAAKAGELLGNSTATQLPG